MVQALICAGIFFDVELRAIAELLDTLAMTPEKKKRLLVEQKAWTVC